MKKIALQLGLALSHAGLLLTGVLALTSIEAFAVAIPVVSVLVFGLIRKEGLWKIASWIGNTLFALSLSWPIAGVSLVYFHIGKFTDASLETIMYGTFFIGGPELAVGMLIGVLSDFFEGD